MPETNPLPDAALEKLERLLESVVKGDNWKEIQQFFALCKEHLPALLARLRSAEAERDEGIVMAGRAQEALRYVMNGLPADDAVWAAYGNADSARAWLAARDARMKREGAAAWLESLHRNETSAGRKHFSVEVCWLLLEANRMRGEVHDGREG